MNGCRICLALVVLAASATAAPAGIFFHKKLKPQNPAERVPVLLGTLKTDQDDEKRAAAAKELRDFDPAGHPEIVPMLIDALQHDFKANVRLEAAQTLSHIRPVSAEVGAALEQAVAKDPSLRVRLQARNLLWQYHLAGYRTPRNDQPPAPPGGPTGEPPLAPPTSTTVNAAPPAPVIVSDPPPARRGLFQRPAPRPQQPQPVTTEPPLLDPVPPATTSAPAELEPPK